MSERTCPSCGETKAEREFWSGARRCRSCVATETAGLRSLRARQDRKRIQLQYGLKVSVSGRRFKALGANAHQLADQVVPKARRDRFAVACSRAASVSGCGVVGIIVLFGGKPFAGDSAVLMVVGAGLLGAWAVLRRTATVLAGPRNATVADVSDGLLRCDLSRVEAEQLEYLRFYATPEWRAIREVIIRRDGRTCRKCSCHIILEFDLTVDHIRPRSRFPELALDATNLQVLCRSCNASKGAAV